MRTIEFLFGPRPEVTLINATPQSVVALMTRGYTGNYSATITPEEELQFFRELGNTKLKAPLEAAQVCFLLEDVTRSFTHQIVRYRTAKIVQESLRFSIQVSEQEQSGNRAKVMVPQSVMDSGSEALEDYCLSCENAFRSYWTAIESGVPTQDARGLLPHNTCTRMFISLDVKTLAHIAEQRYCCQAQGSGAGESGEWTSVVEQMKESLKENGFWYYADQMRAPWEDPECTNCGFGASFDRPCSYQHKFFANLKAKYDAAV